MKTSSSWNRRGSAVTANGFFTVLRSTGWFATFRLPDGYRYATGKSVTDPLHPVDVVGRLAVSNPAANAPVLPQSTIALRQIDSGRVSLRGLLWVAVLTIAAMALTYAALMWIMNSPMYVP
jgi:hypothetical protein